MLAIGACVRDEDAVYDDEVLALARRIESAPENAALAGAVRQREAEVAADPDAAAASARGRMASLGLATLRVPGLFWVSHRWTGADLSGVERWLGAPVPLVETDESGPVEDNAFVVADALRCHSAAGRRVVVWSASKGSADLLEAMSVAPDAAQALAIWIDLVGLLDGTPLTEGDAAGAGAAIGLSADTARSLSTSVRTRAAERTPWPEGLRAVHVAGFPRAATVTDRARPGFERLRALGPNDGWLLLEGLARRRGRVLVVPDADHYLAANALRERVLAVLLVELDALEAGSREARTAGIETRAPADRIGTSRADPALRRGSDRR